MGLGAACGEDVSPWGRTGESSARLGTPLDVSTEQETAEDVLRSLWNLKAWLESWKLCWGMGGCGLKVVGHEMYF